MKYTALVMAASRLGAEDPVAKIQGLSHKCLVVLDGTPMLERVVDTLLATPEIGRVVISIESPEILRSIPALAEMLDSGRISTVKSDINLYQSVLSAVDQLEDPYPLLISTGDNALHTPEMISHYCRDGLKRNADVLVGMTRANDVLAAYPDGMRAFHRLRDQGYSSCNLYSLMNPKAIKGARAFEGGGQFGKKPRRLLKAFGLPFLVLYKLQLITLKQAERLVSMRSGLKLEVVLMPFADAPIDVYNPKDFALTERILRNRRSKAA